MNGVLVFFCVAVAGCLGYNIDTCNNNNQLQVDETGATTLTCSGITDDIMVWTLRHKNGRESQIGNCTWSPYACTVADKSYVLSWRQAYTSQLTIRDDHRNKIAGTVTCAGLYDGRVVNAATCDVRVVYTNYRVTNCQISVFTTTDWTVYGFCYVNQIFASDGKYSCLWTTGTHANYNIAGRVGLSTFTVSGKEYQRMTCTFTGQPLPSEDGTYSYTVTIDPAENPNEGRVGKPLIISSAKGPPVLHSCPDYVIEGGDAHCTCQASASEPPAVVTWSPGINHVVSNTSTLTLSNVSRSMNGGKSFCRQYWGGNSTEHVKTAVFTLNVRYPPPSPPVIQGSLNYTEGGSLHLTCTVTGGNPPVADVALSCGNNNDAEVTATYSNGEQRIRTITISSLDVGFHGSSCECSAKWMERPSLYTSTSTVTIVVQDTTTATAASNDKTDAAASNDKTDAATTDDNSDAATTKDTSDDGGDVKLAAIVGGATGGVAVIIVVVLVIVIVIVRKKLCDPLYARPSSTREADDHTYTELDHYEHITPPGQPPTQRNNNATQRYVYENDSAGNEQLSYAERQYENTPVNMMPASPEREYENTVNNRQEASSDVQYENTAVNKKCVSSV